MLHTIVVSSAIMAIVCGVIAIVLLIKSKTVKDNQPSSTGGGSNTPTDTHKPSQT